MSEEKSEENLSNKAEDSSEDKSTNQDLDNIPKKSLAEIESGRSSKKRVSNKKSKQVEDDEYKSFREILEQKLFNQFINEAHEKSKDLKAKLVSQLSEVFKIFDFNHDGYIDESDLRFTYNSLGEKNFPDEKIKKMISESSKPIDFDAFVSLFESKEMEFDPELDLIKAFSTWDKKNSGLLNEDDFRMDLECYGDRFTEKDADRALEEAPLYEDNGKPIMNYIEFCSNICGLQNIRKTDIFQDKCTRDSRK